MKTSWHSKFMITIAMLYVTIYTCLKYLQISINTLEFQDVHKAICNWT